MAGNPLIDLITLEAPAAANAKRWQLAVLGHAVHSDGVQPQIGRNFLDCEDRRSRHRLGVGAGSGLSTLVRTRELCKALISYSGLYMHE